MSQPDYINGIKFVFGGGLESKLDLVLQNQQRILNTMAENQSQLDAAQQQEAQALQEVIADEQQLASDVKSGNAITAQLSKDFKALVAALPPGVDLTNEVTAVEANITALEQLHGNLQGDDSTVQSSTATDTATDQSVQAEEAALNPAPAPTPAPPAG
jgi:hypothetical protein